MSAACSGTSRGGASIYLLRPGGRKRGAGAATPPPSSRPNDNSGRGGRKGRKEKDTAAAAAAAATIAAVSALTTRVKLGLIRQRDSFSHEWKKSSFPVSASVNPFLFHSVRPSVRRLPGEDGEDPEVYYTDGST